MGRFLRELAAQLGATWKKIGVNQRVSVILVLVLSVVGLWVFAALAKRPTLSLLYTDLTPEDAGKVVEQLRDDSVTYRLKDGGRTIYVPSGKVYEVRVAMANQGLPAGKTVGFSEMFDQGGGFGRTDFEMGVAFLRAQQGELARTIASMDPIADASVTIVRPEKALFETEETPATASVMVRLRGNRTLNAEQISAIRHLVSSAVEGLAPDKVTIVTSDMRVLARAREGDGVTAMTTDQVDLTQHLEQYYAREAQTMLDRAIGPDNAIIRVALTLDFEAINQTTRVAREGALVRETNSKTRVEGSTAGAEANVVVGGPPASGAANGSSESQTSTESEYQPSVDERTLVRTPGAIKRLTASALVNSERKDKTLAVKDFEDLIKAALPFDTARGDLITVREVTFHRQEAPSAAAASVSTGVGAITIAKHTMTAAVAVVLLFFFRSMYRKARAEVLAPVSAGTKEGQRVLTPAGLEEREVEAPLPKPGQASTAQQQICRLADERPEMVASMIREWLKD